MALFIIDSLLTTHHRMQHLNYEQCNLSQMNLLIAITCIIITTLENDLAIEQNSQQRYHTTWGYDYIRVR